MRILLLSPIYPPSIGGPATYSEELSRRLTPEHELTVIAYADRDARAYGGARLVGIDRTRSLPVRLTRFTIAAIRAARAADVIYAQNAVAAGLPAVIAGALSRRPVVIKFVGDEAWERATQARRTTKRLEDFMAYPEGGRYARLLVLIQGFVLRRATLVTTPSAYLRDALVREYGVRDDRAVTNYNATREYAVRGAASRVPRQILVAARLTAWKGIDGILRALAIVRRSHPNATLLIAGDGPERAALEQQARALDLSDAVSFLGSIPHERVMELLEESELFVLNSTYEGLPHTILDAFAAGCGVVATEIAGTTEAVRHEVSGLTVSPHDDEGLARAIIRMFDEPDLRQRLIASGQESLQRFTWERHLRNLVELLEHARSA